MIGDGMRDSGRRYNVAGGQGGMPVDLNLSRNLSKTDGLNSYVKFDNYVSQQQQPLPQQLQPPPIK